MLVFQERGITHLDLHGEKHYGIEELVLDFVLRHQNDIPLIIICGNSNQMIKLVSSSLTTNSITFSSPRFGIIRIEKI